MEGHGIFLEDADFNKVVSLAPLISIDLIIKNNDDKYLLGKRKFNPAKDYWFVPGGRIRKGEEISAAFQRICENEIGVNQSISKADFLGVYEHFYNNSSFSDEVSTHYVVLAFSVMLESEKVDFPMEQNIEFRWFSREMIFSEDEVHNYSKCYFE